MTLSCGHRRLDEIVLARRAPVVLDTAGQLLELELDEPAVVAELDDVALDLVGDAPHHLGALQDGDDVAEVTRSSTSSADSAPVTASSRAL